MNGAANNSTVPVHIVNGDFVAISAGINLGVGFSLALKRDTSVLSWGGGGASLGNGLVLGSYGGGNDDPDGDGLTTAVERGLGTDPYTADTNGDGIPDGVAVRSGISATNPDMDGDGVVNAVEIQRGTDPFRADTDGDGVLDGADCFPLDPLRWQCPPPVPGDATPPAITLTEPASAVLVSTVP